MIQLGKAGLLPTIEIEPDIYANHLDDEYIDIVRILMRPTCLSEVLRKASQSN